MAVAVAGSLCSSLATSASDPAGESVRSAVDNRAVDADRAGRAAHYRSVLARRQVAAFSLAGSLRGSAGPAARFVRYRSRRRLRLRDRHAAAVLLLARAGGFVGGVLWLVVPITLMALGEQRPPLLFLGGVVMTLVLLYLPFVLVRFAAQNRFRAMFEFQAWQWFRRGPWAFSMALLVSLAVWLCRCIRSRSRSSHAMRPGCRAFASCSSRCRATC